MAARVDDADPPLSIAAGALELFGRSRGLGAVIRDHDSYWLWSRAVVDAPVLVAIDVSEARLRSIYDDVQVVGPRFRASRSARAPLVRRGAALSALTGRDAARRLIE